MAAPLPSTEHRPPRWREWVRRYLPAEILGTVIALGAAWLVYAHTRSFIAATAAGWVGEGVGFFSYFICLEFATSAKRYRHLSAGRRLLATVRAASTNLLVEFLPAELVDDFVIRPFLMYWVPQHLHPYPVGFLVGKFGADVAFYALAVVGYEVRKRLARSSKVERARRG